MNEEKKRFRTWLLSRFDCRGCDVKPNAPVPHNRYHALICVRFCATQPATLPENRVASEEHI